MTQLTAPLFSIRARGGLAGRLTYQRRARVTHAARARTSFPPLPAALTAQQTKYATEKLHWLRAPFTTADLAAWNRFARVLPFPATAYNAAMSLFLHLGFSEIFHGEAFAGLLDSPGPSTLRGKFTSTQTPVLPRFLLYGADPRNLTLSAPMVLLADTTFTVTVPFIQPGQWYGQMLVGSPTILLAITGLYTTAVH